MKDRGVWTCGSFVGMPGHRLQSNAVNFRETLENLRLDSHKILTPLSQQDFSKVRDWGRQGGFSNASLENL